jgi:hypothetical protein
MYQTISIINTRSKTRSKRETAGLDKDFKNEKVKKEVIKEEQIKEKEEKEEKEEVVIEDDVIQCVICWGESNVYKMQSFVIVKNSCDCNSTFHGSCFFKWVYETNSCPICRKPSVFNVKILNRFLNKPDINVNENVNAPANALQNPLQNNNQNQIVYNRMATNNGGRRTYDLELFEERIHNKLEIILYVTYNVVKGFCKFAFCLCFYSFLFVTFMSINREAQMIE